MGYAISLDNDGNPQMSFDSDDSIATDLLLSVEVPQGSFFLDPTFGLPELPKKITAQTLPVVQQRFEQALKWLVDTGRAKSIIVTVEAPDEKGRANVLCEAVQQNNQPVTYQTFVEVV